MSAPEFEPSVLADARKEKGGSPEDARQGKNNMLNVAHKPIAVQAVPQAFNITSANKKLGLWIDNLVEKAKDRPISQIVSLTPELASVLLERNPNNRKISKSLVETYAHEIARGAWSFNGQTIIISDTGELNDGQHRCSAVIEAGEPIDVILIAGIKRDTRTTLDQGRARTAADYLSMEGNVNNNVLAAAANFVWQHRLRGTIFGGGNSKATKSEVLELVREYPRLAKSVASVQSSAAAAVGGPSILAFVHFLLKGTRHAEDADFFIHSILNGEGLRAGNPILYARNRLVNERGRLRPNDKAEIIFKAWNAWRRGETLQRLVITGGILPVLEG